MAKVELTIRCARCRNVEKVVTEAWALVKTSCGCNGPWGVLERRELPEEPAAEKPAKTKAAKTAEPAAAGAPSSEVPAAAPEPGAAPAPAPDPAEEQAGKATS